MGTLTVRCTPSDAGLTNGVAVGVVVGNGVAVATRVEVATGCNVGAADGGAVGVAVGSGVEVGVDDEVATGSIVKLSAEAVTSPACQPAKISNKHGTAKTLINRINMRAAYPSLTFMSSI